MISSVSVEGTADLKARSWFSVPLIWLIGLLVVAAVIALTAPAGMNPGYRVGLSMCLSGGALFLSGVRDRHLVFLVGGATTLASGVALLVDTRTYERPVTWVIAASVGLCGPILARTVRRRGAGFIVMATAFAVPIVAGAMFVLFDRQLLSLGVGLFDLALVSLLWIGLSGARATTTRGLALRSTLVAAMGTIADRTDGSERSSIRSKVLFEGDDRRVRFSRFLTLMGFASAIASLGVLADSTAVVIGAMLVAPLLTPLMGMSLSLVTGWTDEFGRAGLVAGAGTLVAVFTGFLASAIIGKGTDITTNTQIVSRSSPTLIDLGIALAAGGAGAYALSRRDVSDALPGVAVAIALVPPLAVVGVTAQLGSWSESAGALLLFVTNALAILSMGALVFIVTGVAANETDPDWRLDHLLVGFAALGVLVLALLTANTAEINRTGADNDIAATTVEDWIGDRSLEVLGVTVDGSSVVVVLSGAEMPDDTDDLATALGGRLNGDVDVTVRLAITEEVVIDV